MGYTNNRNLNMKRLKTYESFINEEILSNRFDSDNPEKEYQKAQKYDKIDKLKWCQTLWNFYNKTLFEKKLPRGVIRFTKNMGVKFRTRGNYSPKTNTIGLNDHLFNVPFDIFKRVFLHEMCHQATFKISGVSKREEGHSGHGPTWVSWMKKVGLKPSQFDIEENDVYLTNDELEKKRIKDKIDLQRKEEADKLKEKVVKEEKQTYPSENKFAKWFDKNNNKWNIGMILIPNDKAGERWIFLNIDGYGSQYMIVPSTWFFVVSPEELERLTAKKKDFDERGSKIIEYKNKKSEVRNMKKFWRSTF